MYNNKSFLTNNCPRENKLKLWYSSININTSCKYKMERNNNYHNENNNFSSSEIEIPIKYKAFFKRRYSASVCIDRSDQWYNEGLFYVKRMGIKKSFV